MWGRGQLPSLLGSGVVAWVLGGFRDGETARGCRSDLLGQCPRGSRWTLPSRLHCGPCRKLAEWSSWPRLSVPFYELKWETPNQETGPGEAKPVAAGQSPMRLHRDESYSQKHCLLSTQRWKPLALRPVSCVVLSQRRGTVPGLALETLNVSSTSCVTFAYIIFSGPPVASEKRKGGGSPCSRLRSLLPLSPVCLPRLHP